MTGGRAALAAACALAAALPADAQRVLVVLSADSPPYREAWEGFRQELGADAAMSLAGEAAATDADVIVAFGAKAALGSRPRRARVIVAMAPSVPARVRVCMTPEPRALLARMKVLQPGLKRLGVIWKSDFYGDRYLPLLRAAGRDAGVDVASYPLAEAGDLPDQLRELRGKVDALWLPPDPLAISEQNFLLLRDFSLASRVPLYVPVPGLAERGATASIGVSFRAIGTEAGRAAKRLLQGEEPPALSFPSPAETTLNEASAADVGLDLSPEARRTAAKVLR